MDARVDSSLMDNWANLKSQGKFGGKTEKAKNTTCFVWPALGVPNNPPTAKPGRNGSNYGQGAQGDAT